MLQSKFTAAVVAIFLVTLAYSHAEAQYDTQRYCYKGVIRATGTKYLLKRECETCDNIVVVTERTWLRTRTRSKQELFQFLTCKFVITSKIDDYSWQYMSIAVPDTNRTISFRKFLQPINATSPSDITLKFYPTVSASRKYYKYLTPLYDFTSQTRYFKATHPLTPKSHGLSLRTTGSRMLGIKVSSDGKNATLIAGTPEMLTYREFSLAYVWRRI